MALPGRSPSHTFPGPRSPTGTVNGHNEIHLPPSIYAPQRSMLPPSPQHYQPRFHNASSSAPSPSIPLSQDSRAPPPPYKRPGSSMSISSMLGGEPERVITPHETYPSHSSRAPSHQGISSASSMSFNNIMSPPQQVTNHTYGEYNYKPRSRTPDRTAAPFNIGITRQRSSSSGTPLQRSDPFIDRHHRSSSNTPVIGYGERMMPQSFGTSFANQHDQEERVRRTSLSGILQRPNSQPESHSQMSQPNEHFKSQVISTAPTAPVHTPLTEAPKQNGSNGLYDTRPPGMNIHKKIAATRTSPPKGLSHSVSPDLRRSNPNGTQSRGLANILNGPTSQPNDGPVPTSQNMSRQDSTQSQSGSAIGDRTKFRAYSPFNSSFTTGTLAGDAQSRKGSDELSQHRAILGLATENKRGRFSPMPQAVQGAQARTPVPDVGVKTEHGRVFSGIGSGIGNTPTPGPFSSSPLKKDDAPMRLSEDNLKTFSRATPGVKRSRKTKDEVGTVEVDAVPGERTTNGRKRNKQHHNYKADLEEMATAAASAPRRNSPLPGFNPVHRVSTPVATNTAMTPNLSQLHSRVIEPTSVFKPRKTIKVSSVFSAAAKNPRRHLGNFTYQPKISQSDLSRSFKQDFDISLTPNLIPSFTESEHVNCTYTIHVPRMWLQPRERELIRAQQHLWGSGIYTDDSDPVAAAMHAGFLKTITGDGVDSSLLSKIISEQNPRIEFPSDLKVPDHPQDVEPDKDLNILMVVLPVLEQYEGSVRFGTRSRTWPDGPGKTQHDGVSFGILSINFVKLGIEEMRVGRTGKGRRDRLRADLDARKRGFALQQQKIEQARQKQIEQFKAKKKTQLGLKHDKLAIPRSVPGGNFIGSRPGSSLGSNVISAIASA